MSNDSKIEILVTNTFWIYLTKIIIQVFNFVVAILVIRKLAVDTFGIYNLLINTFLIISIFTADPISDIFNRFIPELYQNKDYAKIKRLLYVGFVLANSMLIIFLSILSFFKADFAHFLRISNFDVYLISFITYVALMLMKTIAISVLTSLLLHKTSSILKIIHSVLRSILFLVYLHTLDVNNMLYIESILMMLFIIPSIIIITKYLSKSAMPFTPIVNSISRQRVVKYGLFCSFNELGAGIVGKTSDYFIISAISKPYYVGLYSFAYNLFNLIYQILPLKEFQTILRPLFFQKYSKDYDPNEFNNLYNFMVKMMLPVYLIPGVYFFIFGESVITYIYDPKYIDAYWVTTIILLSNFTTAFFYPLGLTIMLKERMEIALYSKIVIVFSIMAGIYAMANYGIIGVAIVTLIGDLSRNLFMYYAIRNKENIKYKWKEYRRYLVIILILIGVFYFSKYLVNDFISLVVVSILFLLLTIIIFIKYHPLNDYDLKLLETIISKRPKYNYIIKLAKNIYHFNPLYTVH